MSYDNIEPKDDSTDSTFSDTHEQSDADSAFAAVCKQIDAEEESHPSVLPNDGPEEIVAGDVTIKSALAREEVLLLDNMFSHSLRGKRFRWNLFRSRVKSGAFDGKRIVLPLDFDRSSNNCRKQLGVIGLKVNKDYTLLRQEMPSGEIFIAIVFI